MDKSDGNLKLNTLNHNKFEIKLSLNNKYSITPSIRLFDLLNLLYSSKKIKGFTHNQIVAVICVIIERKRLKKIP